MPWVSQKASWIGDNSPGPGVTPSMVVISEPAACAANIRQERTATPSNSTVQAPQTPCSQPAWAPLRSSRSRRQSSKVVRGSTSISCTVPLTLSSMRMGSSPLRIAKRIRDGARGQHGGDAAAIGRRGVQVVERVDIAERLLSRGADRFRVERAAGQLPLGALQANRMIGSGADADHDAFAFVVSAKLDLRRRRDESKIAAARIHLMKAAADLVALPTRESHGGQAGAFR